MKPVDIKKDYPEILEMPLYKSIELLVENVFRAQDIYDNPSGIIFDREKFLLDKGSLGIKTLVEDVSAEKYTKLVIEGMKRERKRYLNHSEYDKDIGNYLVEKVIEGYVGKLGGLSRIPITKEKRAQNEIVEMLKGGYIEGVYRECLRMQKDDNDKFLKLYDKAFRIILGDEYASRDIEENREYLRMIDKHVKSYIVNRKRKHLLDIPN